jgi:uncharacterized protein YbjQ (UPF0145 family)
MPFKQCPKCQKDIFVGDKDTFITCKHCETYLTHSDGVLSVPPDEDGTLKTEELKAIEQARSKNDWSDVPLSTIRKAAENIILTTAPFVAGAEIEKEIEIVTAECVFGMNVFKDLFNVARDFFGGRSRSTQQTLRDARKVALTELRREALQVGADAVIAIDLDYQEISGGAGKAGMIMIVASGTAVQLQTRMNA